MDLKTTTDLTATNFRENLKEVYRRSREYGEIFKVEKDGHNYFFFSEGIFELLLTEAGYNLEDEENE